MMSEQTLAFLWRGGLGVLPVVALVLLISKVAPLRPATRHMLWLTALGTLVLAPIVGRLAPVKSVARSVQTKKFDQTTPALSPDTHPDDGAPLLHTDSPRGYGLGATPWRPDHQLRPPKSFVFDLPAPSSFVTKRDRARSLASRPTTATPLVYRGSIATSGRLKSRAPAAYKRSGATGRPAPSRPWTKTLWPDAPVHQSAPTWTKPLASPKPHATRSAPAAPPAIATTPARTGPLRRAWASERETLLAWRARLGEAASALRNTPPLPGELWLGGSLVVLAVFFWRTVQMRVSIRRSRQAPAHITAQVDRVARKLTLAHAPLVCMTDDRVSPLIWCAKKPRLILPQALWNELDEAGKDAVLHHELAHLKRRDHWLRWADLLAGVAYWWHPAVWFIRRRLRDEADLCCDAWVTALLPTHRRAYAQALLSTKAFLSCETSAPQAIGLGAGPSRTKRFARRLTMVMLHRTRPGSSLAGLLLVVAIAGVGLATAPLFASPPEDGAVAAVHPVKEKEAKPAPEAKSEAQSESKGEAENETTFEKYLEHVEREKTAQKRTAAKEKERRAKAMARTKALREKVMVKAKAQRAKAMAKARTQRAKAKAQAEAARTRARALAKRARKRVESPKADECESHGASPSVRIRIERELAGAQRRLEQMRKRLHNSMSEHNKAARRLQERMGAFVFRYNNDCDDDDAHHDADRDEYVVVTPRADAPAAMVEHSYKLPADKLEKLVALMAREDVPILVRPGDGEITVIATPRNQRVFGAFVSVINPQDREETYTLDSEGKLGALQSLMTLDSVPVAVRSGDDDITVRGSRVTQHIFDAFVKMIDGETATPDASMAPRARRGMVRSRSTRPPMPPHAPRGPRGAGGVIAPTPPHAPHGARDAGGMFVAPTPLHSRRTPRVNALRDREQRVSTTIKAVQKRARKLAAHADRLAVARQQLLHKAQEINAMRDRMDREADRIDDKADELSDRADDLEERAEQINDASKREEIFHKAEGLREQAKVMASRAEEMEVRLEQMEAQLEQIEAQIDEIEEQVESLREGASDLVESLQDREEAIEEQTSQLRQNMEDALREAQDNQTDAQNSLQTALADSLDSLIEALTEMADDLQDELALTAESDAEQVNITDARSDSDANERKGADGHNESKKG